MADIRDKFSDLDPDVLKGMEQTERFFHDMQLTDEFRTGSWVYGESLPPNYHLWPVFSYLNQIDLTGQTCLDIGTYDGMTAFVMAEKGSARVDATCQFDLDRFRIVRALKKYQTIHYHPQTDIKSMSQSFDAGAYDVVVISAMLHHLTSPFDGLAEARRLLRRNGLFILEAAVFDRPDAAIYLNTEIEDPVYGAPTIFIPSVRALRGMLKLACFDVLSETRMLGTKDSREPNYERFTFLARAVRPEEVQARTKKTEEIHTSVASVGDLNFKQLSNEQASSTVHYAGQKGTRNLNVWTHREDYPLSPPGRAASAEFKTLFSVAREKDFMKLVGRVPDGAFSWQDVYLLGVRYPGETMPEGMTWSVKQLGNLHVLDYVRRQGTAEVIEVGPGFNFYFINHLPEWCTYTGLDSSGFYDKELVTAANRARKQVRMLEGLLGQSIDGLAANSVDACISVS
ncbi:MAG: class I SAM-dependent methyltransferase, partial [Hyphomicrobium sp.]